MFCIASPQQQRVVKTQEMLLHKAALLSKLKEWDVLSLTGIAPDANV